MTVTYEFLNDLPLADLLKLSASYGLILPENINLSRENLKSIVVGVYDNWDGEDHCTFLDEIDKILPIIGKEDAIIYLLGYVFLLLYTERCTAYSENASKSLWEKYTTVAIHEEKNF
jgi:hypothetical protein